MELIGCRGLTLQRGEVLLLEATDLSIKTGERVLLTGPSGCGKSTLLRHLCMLEPGGEEKISVKGKLLADWAPAQLRRCVAYLPQTPVMLEGSVRDNLCLAFSLRVSCAPLPGDKAMREELESLDLNISLDTDARNLSPGQKARVALLQRLLLKPEVLLCDEPIAALDEQNAALVARLLERASLEGMAQVVVSHQPLEGFQGRHYRFVSNRLEPAA
ncbi:ABC transporter ATP-binding protein [Marinobacterium lutimaris]|uniref:Putative ABC transport system ATP-binding protein n=1 Tax=Marinobacterium lutimaris TaxID=568106 RepID=A0A1H5WT74_9GAMM|nr:ATP-binding cassette domain-containing protein [Marinobacterium lutimaris]SEG02644.1 putative ABC transport system ATP-binding protein [Marinobacterium lutimaris]